MLQQPSSCMHTLSEARCYRHLPKTDCCCRLGVRSDLTEGRASRNRPSEWKDIVWKLTSRLSSSSCSWWAFIKFSSSTTVLCRLARLAANTWAALSVAAGTGPPGGSTYPFGRPTFMGLPQTSTLSSCMPEDASSSDLISTNPNRPEHTAYLAEVLFVQITTLCRDHVMSYQKNSPQWCARCTPAPPLVYFAPF